MVKHITISNADLYRRISTNEICMGGNKKLKIYGTLTCASGKRMKKENRVFFNSEQEAILQGYRPCGHCMRANYQQYKSATGK